jgi:hypothetical protein
MLCTFGSVKFTMIESIEELIDIVALASKFLIRGALLATLASEKVYRSRERNRRLGPGVLGFDGWLLKRG